jgi:hypothetical protein
MRAIGDRFFEDKDAWVVVSMPLSLSMLSIDIEQQEEEK